MCARFFVSEETEAAAGKMADIVSLNRDTLHVGDIHPSENAMVIAEQGDRLCLRNMRWGLQGPSGSGLVINARVETALEKPLFRDSVRYRRCVMPADRFYEWNAEKTKHTFSWNGHSTFYLAGFYDRREQEDRFVVLTTSANASMLPVHERMPLIFDEKQAKAWIIEDTRTENYLRMNSPMLTDYVPFRQQSIFDLL